VVGCFTTPFVPKGSDILNPNLRDVNTNTRFIGAPPSPTKKKNRHNPPNHSEYCSSTTLQLVYFILFSYFGWEKKEDGWMDGVPHPNPK
jgi:hypothetical protein